MALKRRQRPPRPEVRHSRYRRIAVNELKPVAEANEKSYRRIVANWENKPDFKATITLKPDRIEIETVIRRPKKLEGSNVTVADLWRWIDKTGTKPHVIKPKKRGGILRFPWGGKGSYQSKTNPNPARFGGPGTVRNPTIRYAKQVQHPGFPPRKFSEAVERDLKRDFDNAIRRLRRKASKVV